MKAHYRNIYDHHTHQYDQLVSREDYHGNLRKLLQSTLDFQDKIVVELGAGTGRLTTMIAPWCRKVYAFDQSDAMLAIAKGKLEKLGINNVTLTRAEHRELPLGDHCADLAIEGWSFGHLVEDPDVEWSSILDQAISELRRILKPTSTIALIETLGTGKEQPQAPSQRLQEVFSYLETKHGFVRQWTRTDYQFESTEEATALTSFFFGEAMLAKLSGDEKNSLPECTGLWTLTIR